MQNNAQRFVSAITSFLLVSGELLVWLSRLNPTKQLFELTNNNTNEPESNESKIAKGDKKVFLLIIYGLNIRLSTNIH